MTESDIAQSKGWQRLMREAVTALQRHRGVVLLGSSGSGRTSLVERGLLPHLRSEGLQDAPVFICPAPIRPGSEPVSALASLLLPDTDLSSAVDRIRGEPAWLVAQLESRQQRVVLTVDDLDEVFSLADSAESDAFIAAILALHAGGHYLIIVVQSEYIGRLVRSAKISHLIGECAVTTAFDASELRQVIEAPARRIGLFFESGVIDRLVRSTQGDPAALAMLQFSLWRLWQRRRRNWITIAAYLQIGGGRLALERAAEEAYGKLQPNEQQLARRIFLGTIRPRLAGFSTGTISVKDLEVEGCDPDATTAVIDHFVNAGLLKRMTPGDRVALAHEAVVTNWLRLNEWLDVKRAKQLNRLLLHSTVSKWQTQNKDRSLLWPRRQLSEASSFQDLSRIEVEFLAASRRNATLRRFLMLAGLAVVLSLLLLVIVQEGRAKRAEEAAREARAALALASGSAEKGTRLFNEGDATASALWLADAFDRTESALKKMTEKGATPSPEEVQLRNVRLERLAMALQQVPTLAAQVVDPQSTGYALRPDGRQAITTNGKEVKLWNLDEETCETINGPGAEGAAFSLDGRFFALMYRGKQESGRKWGVQLWSVEPRAKLDHGWLETDGPPVAVYFDPQARYVAALTAELTGASKHIRPMAYIWTLDGSLLWKREEEITVNHLAFSLDGRLVALSLGALGGASGSVAIRHLDDLKREPLVIRLPASARYSDFGPDGTRIVPRAAIAKIARVSRRYGIQQMASRSPARFHICAGSFWSDSIPPARAS